MGNIEKKITPHSKPTLGAKEARAAAATVRSGFIAQGPKVREFEKALARFAGVEDAVAVSSGTAALHLGLLAMGIEKGDEVILPSYVCTAPLNAVYYTGATPVISDIDADTFNILPESVADKKTKAARAVIVPHMFGAPADIEEIEKIGVPVVEDCAHSIGAGYGKKKVGSMGIFSICSFYANKMMACGEGGALLSSDRDIIATVRDLRDYDNREDYKVRYNYKMSDVLAAIGLVQLAALPSMIRKRKKLAAAYDKAFRGLSVGLPKGEFDHAYYRYVIKVKGKDIGGLMSELNDKGVVTARPVFKPLHRYLELRSSFRNTDEAYYTSLSIPIYPSLTPDEQEKVIKAVRDCLS